MEIKLNKILSKDTKRAIVSGILLGIAFPPFPFPYLMFVGLIPYLIALENKKTLAEVNRLTYLMAFVFCLISLYWVGSWTKEADPFLMISGVALLFFNPILFLIPSSLYHLTQKYINRKATFFLLPFFWVSYEYLYSVTEFRFPWLTLGNGVSHFTSFIQIADIIGAYGLSLIILFINVLLYLTYINWGKNKNAFRKYLFLSLLMITLPLIYGGIKLSEQPAGEEKLRVGLIQPDFNPWLKWDAGNLEQQLNIYLKLSQQAVDSGAQFIAWPESALPVYLLSGSYPDAVNKIHKFADSNGISLLTGMPDVRFFDSTNAPWDAKKSSTSRFYYTTYNSALLFNPNERDIQRYGKIKLVPFGEKVPYVNYLPFIGELIKWNVGISSWNTGQDTVVFNIKNKTDISFASLICIESIYPDFTAQFVNRSANFIAVITNDSWYGYSSGPFQHRDISRLRAVENRRYVVRAANGGISCIINPRGEIIKETGLFERSVLVGDIYISREITFFTRHPLVVPFLCLFVTILMLLFSSIKFIKKVRYGKDN